MAGPWERYGGQQGGDPIIAPPDPYKVRDEQRAAEDQAIQREGAERAAAAEARAVAKAERERIEWEATHNADGSLKPVTGGKPTESESTAAFLTSRLVTAAGQLSRVPDGAMPSLFAEGVRTMFGDTAANFANDGDRQRVEAAQLDFIDAALTLGTGAAYTKEQLEGYRRSYFPALGDDAATVKDKRERLAALIESAKLKAGAAAPKIDEAAALIFPGGIGAPGGEGGDISFSEEGGIHVRVTDDSPRTPGSGGGLTMGQFGKGLAQGAGDIVEGVGDTLGIVTNPVGQALYNSLGYDQTFDQGQILRDMSGLPDNPNALTSAINQGGASAMTFGSLAGIGSKFVSNPVARNAMLTVAENPISNMAAGSVGASSGEIARQAGAGPGGQAVAEVIGGVAGYAGGRGIANATSPRALNAVGQAAQDLGVTMLPADAGGTGTRLASGVVGRTFGEIPMANAAQESRRTAGNARTRIADNMGQIADEAGAGQAAQRGARSFAERSGNRLNEIEDRIPVPADATVDLTNTRAALADIDAGFRSNPALNQAWRPNQRITGTLNALREGDLSWGDLRALRTQVGKIIGRAGNSDGADIQNMERLYAALSEDMGGTVAQYGDRALTMWNRYNQYNRGRMDRVNGVLKTILGKGEEQAAQQINRWAQQGSGNFKALAQTLRSLEPEEANTIRASLVGALGTAKKGAQDNTGDVFSPATFGTEWAGLSDRAKAMLFPEAEHRAAIEKFAMLMSNMKQSSKYENHSNTGLIANAAAFGGAAVTGLMDTVTAGMTALGSYGAGVLLSSPRVARFLASAPQSASPQAKAKWIETLGVIAGREPAIGMEAQQLQQFLLNANDTLPSRVAAEEEQQDGRRIPVE